MATVLQDKSGTAIGSTTFRDPITINGGIHTDSDVYEVRDSRGNRTDVLIDGGYDSGSRGDGHTGTGTGTGSDRNPDTTGSGVSTDNDFGRTGRNVPNSDSPFTDNVWSPDTNASPDDNLASLQQWLYSLFNSNYVVDGSLLSGGTFANILMQSLAAIGRFANAVDYDDNARGALAEKVADFAASFIQAQFQAALSYQSWYLQQEYNSPVNQMNRLAEAGLSCAFIFGGLSSGNAQSAASMPSMSPLQSSGAAQIQQQQDAANQSLFGQIFGTAVQGVGTLISAGATAVLSLAQAATIKAMRPYEISKAGSEIVNNAATFEVLRYNAQEMRNNILLKNVDTQLGIETSFQNQYKTSMETAQTNYQNAWQNYTSEETTTEWETNVIDKSGNRKKFRLSADQVQNALRNGGKISDNEVIEGSSSWGVDAKVQFDAEGKVILPVGVVKGKQSVAVGGQYGKSNVNTNGHYDESNFDQTHGSSNSISDYSEDGSMFRVGQSTFTSVTSRKRVPLPEHRQYIQNTLRKYLDALDEYNTYTTGARARMLRLLDELHQNQSSFSASSLEAVYREQVNKLFSPVVYQGD